jgi:putative membrane protein
MFGQWGMGYGYGYGGIFMILWWVLIIVGIVALVRWLMTSAPSRAGRQAAEKSALDILKERYARGEIEQEEFQRKKRELSE